MIKYLRYLSHRLRQIQELVDRQEHNTRLLMSLTEQQERVEAQLQQLPAQLAALQEQLAQLTAQQTQQRSELAAVQATTAETLSQLGRVGIESVHSHSQLRQALGRVEVRQTKAEATWEDQGMQVYSQFGEDGYLQHLIRQLPGISKTFVEFGVEDYQQANTRFLLEKDRWRGLVLDGSEENIARVQADALAWWRELTARAAFITRENINSLLSESGFAGELGILSIDIDGNDYWIWEAIEAVTPALVVIEYNFRFGAERRLVVPYDPNFSKNEAHPSALYYGASLAALEQLGKRKGYDLVGCSEGGVNAFFVRSACRPSSLPIRTAQEAYVRGSHQEWREPLPEGGHRLRHATFAEQQALLLSLPLIELPEAPL